jgi:hypothetical protein
VNGGVSPISAKLQLLIERFFQALVHQSDLMEQSRKRLLTDAKLDEGMGKTT